ncbi:MAG: asparagine synthase C-terminal domain-containing protein, partial [Lachnospiraceae bacterium]|nr:asparagine synthase C-terminal domain-containing protein [Lachnospiraceae bacterium]
KVMSESENKEKYKLYDKDKIVYNKDGNIFDNDNTNGSTIIKPIKEEIVGNDKIIYFDNGSAVIIYKDKNKDPIYIPNKDSISISPRGAIDEIDDFIYLFEDVYLTSPIPMMLLYGALRKDNTLVTIDGHGADELFGGYTFDFIHALRDAHGRRERNMVLDAYLESFPKDGSNIALKNASRSSVYFNYLKRCIKDRLRSGSETYKNVRAAGDERYEKMDTLNKILYVSSHESILPTLLRNYDRYSMASGVEIRMPFMDHRIVSFAMSIGWKSKLHGGYSKSIIRDAMAPYMPEEIAYRRTKIGFNTPIVEWMQGPLKEYFTDIITSESFKACDLLDPDSVSSKVKAVINDPGATFAQGEQAWSALYPYLWEMNVLKRL